MYQSGKDLVQLLKVWKVEALWAQVVQKVLEESVVGGGGVGCLCLLATKFAPPLPLPLPAGGPCVWTCCPAGVVLEFSTSSSI